MTGSNGAHREIKEEGIYRLRPSSDRRRNYFEKKYGTSTPVYVVESNTRKLWPGGWYHDQSIGCFLALSALLPDYGIPTIISSPAFYGKISGMGEIVLIDEIGEEVVSESESEEGTAQVNS